MVLIRQSKHERKEVTKHCIQVGSTVFLKDHSDWPLIVSNVRGNCVEVEWITREGNPQRATYYTEQLVM